MFVERSSFHRKIPCFRYCIGCFVLQKYYILMINQKVFPKNSILFLTFAQKYKMYYGFQL